MSGTATGSNTDRWYPDPGTDSTIADRLSALVARSISPPQPGVGDVERLAAKHVSMVHCDRRCAVGATRPVRNRTAWAASRHTAIRCRGLCDATSVSPAISCDTAPFSARLRHGTCVVLSRSLRPVLRDAGLMTPDSVPGPQTVFDLDGGSSCRGASPPPANSAVLRGRRGRPLSKGGETIGKRVPQPLRDPSPNRTSVSTDPGATTPRTGRVPGKLDR
jgi:hypothetical protein